MFQATEKKEKKKKNQQGFDLRILVKQRHVEERSLAFIPTPAMGSLLGSQTSYFTCALYMYLQGENT